MGRMTWKALYEKIHDGKTTGCEAFVEFMEDYVRNYPNHPSNPAYAAAGYLRRSSFYDKGKTGWLMRRWHSKPEGYGEGDFGAVFEEYHGSEDLQKRLGFNESLAPNQHWNFAHFTGLAFAKAVWSSEGKERVIQQLEEDTRELAEARNGDKSKVPEKCAEVTIDLLALRWLDGIEAAQMRALRTIPIWDQNEDSVGRAIRKEYAKFLSEFSLGKKLCKRDDGEKCDCEQAEKELLEYLKGIK